MAPWSFEMRTSLANGLERARRSKCMVSAPASLPLSLHEQVCSLMPVTIEPSANTVLSEVADCDEADFEQAIDAAYIAQESYYESTTAAQRGAFLRKWCNLILSNQQDR